MLLYTHQITENTLGGGPIGWVGGYLGHEDINFGTAISTIEVTIRSNPDLPGKRLVRSRMPGMLSHQDQQSKAPQRVTFRRKEKKLFIHWMTKHLHETEMERHIKANATTALFLRAAKDVAEALDWGLHQRIKPSDDFDIAACLAWVKSAQQIAEPSEAAFRATLMKRSEQHRKRSITAEFRAKIKTDWATMHEDAAYLLGHLDFWNETDARMPHGNALGAGILQHFNFYQDLSLDEVLKTFNLPTYQDASNPSDKIKVLQIELGLVFAHIKKRGTVAQPMVNALVHRMKIEANVDKSFWVHRSKYGTSSHLTWMLHYLDRFT